MLKYDLLIKMHLFPISIMKVIKDTTLPWCRRIYYALTIHFITVKGDARHKINNI